MLVALGGYGPDNGCSVNVVGWRCNVVVVDGAVKVGLDAAIV